MRYNNESVKTTREGVRSNVLPFFLLCVERFPYWTFNSEDEYRVTGLGSVHQGRSTFLKTLYERHRPFVKRLEYEDYKTSNLSVDRHGWYSWISSRNVPYLRVVYCKSNLVDLLLITLSLSIPLCKMVDTENLVSLNFYLEGSFDTNVNF